MRLGTWVKLVLFAGLLWWAFKLGENHILTTHGVAPVKQARTS